MPGGGYEASLIAQCWNSRGILRPSLQQRQRPREARSRDRPGHGPVAVFRILEAYRLEGGEYVLEQQVQGDGVFEPALFPGLKVHLAALWA